MAFKYTNYLITPADIYQGVLHLKKNIRRQDFLGIIILALVFSYTNHLGWQIDSSVFFCFFSAIFFWNLDSRIPIALALIFLTSCPFLLIAYNDYNFLWGEDWAETAAAWAYYFLVFGAVKKMWDFRKEGEETNTPPHSKKTRREYWIPVFTGMTNPHSEKPKRNAGFPPARE